MQESALEMEAVSANKENDAVSMDEDVSEASLDESLDGSKKMNCSVMGKEEGKPLSGHKDKPLEPTNALVEGSVAVRTLTFEEKEAKLNAYLEEQEKQAKIDAENLAKEDELSSCKPKRRTKAELLKSLPGDIWKKKPTIRPSSKTVIDFDEDFKSTKDNKKKGIEDLMNRFMIHTAVHKPPKEEHYKIHITKKEEDSEGIPHLRTDEAEYVKVMDDEEIEETSPQCQGPGVKMGQLKAKLLSEIRANRAKAYEEKMKAHAMYSEEKELDDKEGAGEDEEILLDEDMSEESENEESEADEKDGNDSDDDVIDEDGEDVETLLDSNPKKKKTRKRLVFLEDEADESGEERSGDEDEDKIDRANKDDFSFIDDRPISDEEDDSEDEKRKDNVKAAELNNSEGFLVDTDSQKLFDTQSEECVSQDLFSNAGSQQLSGQVSQSPRKEKLSQENPIYSFLDPNKTPKISAAILNHSPSPIGPWNSISSHHHTNSIRNPGSRVSPMIPRLTSEAALDAFYEDLKDNEDVSTRSPAISAEVAKLVGSSRVPATPTNDDDLEAICSAKFPSQQPETPKESQDFDGFQFCSQDVDSVITDTPELTSNCKTNSLVDKYRNVNETPKTGDKAAHAKNTRLNFNAEEPQDHLVNGNTEIEVDGDDEDDDASVIGVKIQRKRKRRLHFSDDESGDDSDAEGKNKHDSETDEETLDEIDQAPVGTDDDTDKEYDENEEEIPQPKFAPIRSSKTGKIRTEFVDAEAELSGSEMGSADEDEHGEDAYEEEICDAEELDEEKLRDQIGRAHLKQLLDDDQREINYLQNVYLEDGDLHTDGKGRERKFRWKNLDDLAFEGARMEEAGGEAIEDEFEIKWRQEKLEKIKWMRENSLSLNEDAEFEETSQKLLEGSHFLKLGKSTLRKMQKSLSVTETAVVSTSTGKSPGTTLERKGSFLQRESTLSRFAEMTRINDSMNKKKGKSFVFAMVTPPNDPEKSKGPSKRVSAKNQPKKMLKIDRSFESLNDSQSQNSIFKWM